MTEKRLPVRILNRVYNTSVLGILELKVCQDYQQNYSLNNLQ